MPICQSWAPADLLSFCRGHLPPRANVSRLRGTQDSRLSGDGTSLASLVPTPCREEIREHHVPIILHVSRQNKRPGFRADLHWLAWKATPAAPRVQLLAGTFALVHGDSHYFKVDKPINLPSGGVLANFTRVETFGARQTHWVSATINPGDPNLFEFQPRIVPANVG
jgi:hypothetical protein